MNWPEIEEVVYSECDRPQDILGMHPVKGGFIIQAFLPYAENVSVRSLSNGKVFPMEKVDEEGFFAVFISGKAKIAYEYDVTMPDGSVKTLPEVYHYIPQFWLNLLDKFKSGTFYDSYKYFGAHFCERKGVLGTEFMVYAKNASRVSVVGDFNGWDGRVHQMCRLNDEGIFGLFIPGVLVGALYKFEIKLHNGLTFLKRDPYALSIEKGKGDAGRVIEDPKWETVKFKRSSLKPTLSLVNLSLRDLVEKFGEGQKLSNQIVSFVKEFGYDAVLFEDFGFCNDKSICKFGKPSFFAVCPEVMRLNALVELTDALHEFGIKVFSTVDISGFLPDDNGLRGFDGSWIYEKDDCLIDGIMDFNMDYPYVRNYLISVCDYFVKILSLDGLCIGGTDRILYLNYKKEEGSYTPNIYGGCESVSGFEFFKELNGLLHQKYSNIITIAKDSLVSNTLTSSLEDNGLGFDFKIHTQFDRDLFEYLKNPFAKRSHHHSEITYSPVYIHCEKFILSYLYSLFGTSKAEMQKTLPGNKEEKEKGFRLAVSYLFLHPGRKLLPYFDSSDETTVNIVKELNRLYHEVDSLGEDDDSDDCFEWINAIDSENSVVSFMRRYKNEELLVICNFSNKDINYSLGVKKGCYKEIFTSDHSKFGGKSRLSGKAKEAVASKKDGMKYTLTVKVSSLSLHVYEKTPCQND